MSDTLAAFARLLVPRAYDKTEASARRVPVELALKSSSLNVHYLFESGSWTHGTSIVGKSDVDYFAWAIGSRTQLPSSALRAAKSAIESCDWKIQSVNVDAPAVSITYYTPPHLDIVPAWYQSEVRGFNVFWIPGRGDDWILSAPAAHLAYVNEQHARLSGKVKPLVRMVKAWKYHVQAPISSFYLEMRTAEYAATQAVIVYSIDLVAVFRKMIAEGLRDMNDPQGIAGRIPACSSENKRRATLNGLREALAHLELASDAENKKDQRAYWGHMYHVFGDGFPWPDW